MPDAFNLGSEDQGRFGGLGAAGIPDVRDDLVKAYLDSVTARGPAAVTDAMTGSSEAGRRVVSAFAERAASRAVRESDPALLVDALVALALGGITDKELGALMRMAIVEDAVERIGEDFPSLVKEASDLVGHPAGVGLTLWLMRKPEDRTLDSMGFELADTPDGPRYRWKL